MPNSPTAPSAAPQSWRRDLLLLAVSFGALYFAVLGGHPLSNPDEGRYASIPREMIASHDYVTPRLNGVNYFEKPPLLYWAVAGCMQVFGFNEWAVRIMPALSGLGGVLLTYAAARRWQGRAVGLASAVVLGTSLLFFALSRILILDMAVSMLMCATLFCFILGVREAPGARRRWLFYGLYASAALATLTKGLIGFLVTGAVMFLWLLIFNQWKRLRPLHLPRRKARSKHRARDR
jgi:4-amino-4-deoxy-L-arabinose transferase-like glycosyltransferase